MEWKATFRCYCAVAIAFGVLALAWYGQTAETAEPARIEIMGVPVAAPGTPSPTTAPAEE